MNLFYITFACVGMMFILKYGTLLDEARAAICEDSPFFTELFQCALCLGFWCGMFIGIATDMWLLPFYSAAICWLVDIALDIIIRKYQL